MNFKQRLGGLARRNLTSLQFGRLFEFYESIKKIAYPFQVRSSKSTRVGKRTYIDRRAHFLGWQNIRIGTECVISEDCWFNVSHRSEVEIGDYSHIGRRNFFSPGRRIRLGPYALLGMDCKLIGSDHSIADPMLPYVTTGATSESEIDIGANCWFGANVIVLGHVKIGHGSVIGAASLVLKDIPPFSLVVGSPARVLKRYDIKLGRWVNLDDFTEENALLLPDEARYLEILRAAKPYVRMPRAAAGRAWGDTP